MIDSATPSINSNRVASTHMPSSYTDRKKMHRKHTGSAILPNGKVNISLIQHEIARDLSADARYHAEDGMKKRAIHMSE